MAQQKQLDNSVALDYITQHIDELNLTQDDLKLILNTKPNEISYDQHKIAIAVNHGPHKD